MRDWSGPLPHKEYIQTINCSSYSHQTRVLFPTNVKGENNMGMWGERKKAADWKKTPLASFKRRFWMKPCSEPVALRICMKLCLQRVPLGIWPAGVREYSVKLPNAQPPGLCWSFMIKRAWERRRPILIPSSKSFWDNLFKQIYRVRR